MRGIKLKPMRSFIILLFQLVVAHSIMAQSVKDTTDIRYLLAEKTYSTIQDLQVQQRKVWPDVQNKYVIINFWATWCGPCLKELPVLNALAKKYPDKLTVLSVSYEDSSKVIPFLKNHPELKAIHFISNDQVLHNRFKHRIIPHNIWIDNKGEIKYATGAEEINEENMRGFINDQALSMRKKTDVIDFDYRKTLHLIDSNFKYRSILGGYIPGIYSESTYRARLFPSGRKIQRLLAGDRSLYELYEMAVGKLRLLRTDYNLIDVRTSDSTKFFWPVQCPESFRNSKYETRDEWIEKNLYSYELILPRPVLDSVFCAYMLNDLDRSFGIEHRVITKPYQSLIIRGTVPDSISKSSSDIETMASIDIKDGFMIAKNILLIDLLHQINAAYLKIDKEPTFRYIFNESEVQYPIDIKIPVLEHYESGDQLIYAICEQLGLKTRLEVREVPSLELIDR